MIIYWISVRYTRKCGWFSDVLNISPLFGLGASGNELNQVIEDLFLQVQEKLVICTLFQLPSHTKK